jgi:hypothetical protein
MDQETLTGNLPPIPLTRDLANTLSDIRCTCDDRGAFSGWKYPIARLRPLERAGLVTQDSHARWALTERGRLAPFDIQPGPSADATRRKR